MTELLQSLRRAMCGLRGHQEVFHFERHRLSLRCLDCGHETPGWILVPETRQARPSVRDFSHHHNRFALRHWILRRLPT
jgi:uncharacterized Zn finger protein